MVVFSTGDVGNCLGLRNVVYICAMSVSMDAIVIMVQQWSMMPGANEKIIFCHALLKERGGLVQLMEVNNPNPTTYHEVCQPSQFHQLHPHCHQHLPLHVPRICLIVYFRRIITSYITPILDVFRAVSEFNVSEKQHPQG